MTNKIRVCVRVRPLSRRELDHGAKPVVQCESSTDIMVAAPRVKVDMSKYNELYKMKFDRIFSESSCNKDVYAQSAAPLIDAVFLGARTTCFAYGQTGAGKTHTMMGTSKEPGLYALAARDIFKKLEASGTGEYFPTASFFEIYSRGVYDLLEGRKKLNVREDAKGKVNICGLREVRVSSVKEVMLLIEEGLESRVTSAHAANDTSSRSHAVLQIILRKTSNQAEYGKFSCVDLAGSERGSETLHADRQARIEGAEINKSLLALKECIRAMGMGSSHVPFRGGKLTEVLKDSFTGSSCMTVMVAAVSPNHICVEHTLNTLRYANRVKELKRADNKKGDRRIGVPIRKEKVFPDFSHLNLKDKENAIANKLNALGDENDDPYDNRRPDPGHGERRAVKKEHKKLLQTLAQGEERIIVEHRKALEKGMEHMQREMKMLAVLEEPYGSVDKYVEAVDRLMEDKIKNMIAFHDVIRKYRKDLKKEEMMTVKLQKLPQITDLDEDDDDEDGY